MHIAKKSQNFMQENNNLQRKIYFNNNPKDSFRRGWLKRVWCLNELDENNKQIGNEYYLFRSSVRFFVSSNLHIERNIQIETKDINKKNETTQDVVITASLSPSLSPELKEPVVYEMFGTEKYSNRNKRHQ